MIGVRYRRGWQSSRKRVSGIRACARFFVVKVLRGPDRGLSLDAPWRCGVSAHLARLSNKDLSKVQLAAGSSCENCVSTSTEKKGPRFIECYRDNEGRSSRAEEEEEKKWEVGMTAFRFRGPRQTYKSSTRTGAGLVKVRVQSSADPGESPSLAPFQILPPFSFNRSFAIIDFWFKTILTLLSFRSHAPLDSYCLFIKFNFHRTSRSQRKSTHTRSTNQIHETLCTRALWSIQII